MSELSGRNAIKENTPSIFAWCDESLRIEAFLAALSALTSPSGLCSLMEGAVFKSGIPVADVPPIMRAELVKAQYTYVSFGVEGPSGRSLAFSGRVCTDHTIRRGSTGPLEISPFDKEDLVPVAINVATGHRLRSVEVDAAIACHVAIIDLQTFFMCLCAPDETKRVTTGACTRFWHWGAPVGMAATYHADGCVARDLALSWIHLRDGDRLELAAGRSLDALHAHIEASPKRSSISIKGGGTLTREEVLAALATPPSTLVDALDACAIPDDEWHTAELRARELLIAMEEEHLPLEVVNVSTGKHVRFIQHHAPYHIGRLPHGGVMLATHPYRTLWQLWIDALLLLGIRTEE